MANYTQFKSAINLQIEKFNHAQCSRLPPLLISRSKKFVKSSLLSAVGDTSELDRGQQKTETKIHVVDESFHNSHSALPMGI